MLIFFDDNAVILLFNVMIRLAHEASNEDETPSSSNYQNKIY